jgi:hypothetical protein
MGRTAVLLVLVLLVHTASAASIARPFRVPLDANSTFSWVLDYPAATVNVEVHTPAGRDDWVSVGFSDYGSLVGADLCVLWRDWRGRTHMQVGLQSATTQHPTTPLIHFCTENVAQSSSISYEHIIIIRRENSHVVH